MKSPWNHHEITWRQVALSSMHTCQDVHHGTARPAIPWAKLLAADGIWALQEKGVLSGGCVPHAAVVCVYVLCAYIYVFYIYMWMCVCICIIYIYMCMWHVYINMCVCNYI
jgi:hypothetical protein